MAKLGFFKRIFKRKAKPQPEEVQPAAPVVQPIIKYIPTPAPKCVCPKEKTCPAPPVAEPLKLLDDSRVVTSLAITAVSSTLVLILLTWALLFRRKARRQRKLMKMDNQMILAKIEELTEELEDRDNEKDVLEQRIKVTRQAGDDEKAQLEARLTSLLQSKETQFDNLQSQLDEVTIQKKELDSKLKQTTTELKKFSEKQQDHECQVLEHKLQASQLANAISERDAQIEVLTKTNNTQTARIIELEQKMKADSQKAEKIIENLSREKDERFAVLQEENDAIKKTIMGLLYQTQEKYDRDKMLLKKEMRNRDSKIAKLQQELWKSNALLKRLQSDYKPNLSESVSQLILEKETEETAKKERRSSTYEAVETILEDDSEPVELKQLQNLLQGNISTLQ